MADLLTYKTFDASKMIFADDKQLSVPGVNARRVDIKYAYDATTSEKCAFKTPKLFSWGVSVKQQPPVNGVPGAYTYRLPIVMHEKDTRPTADEAGTIEMCEQMKKRIQDHLREKKLATHKRINEMDFFLWPRDKETEAIIPGTPPTMYPKLKTVYEKDRVVGQKPKIATGFYTAANKPITNVLALEKRRCRVRAHIIVDNIYIGADKVIVQLKVQDVIVVERIEPKQLLFAEPEDAAFAAAEEDEDDAEVATIFKKKNSGGACGDADDSDDGFAFARGSRKGKKRSATEMCESARGVVPPSDDDDEEMMAMCAKQSRP
jgi:hypothetical protein